MAKFGPKPRPVKERLLENMAVNTETNCWIWLGGCNHKGYGKIGIEGKTVTTHRASYIEFKGQVPEGKMLRHTCDNRKCFNPEHLVAGTNADNWQDAYNRGTRKGLTNENCLQLFLMKDWGLQYREIAKVVDQDETAIRFIIQMKERPYVAQLYYSALKAQEEAA